MALSTPSVFVSLMVNVGPVGASILHPYRRGKTQQKKMTNLQAKVGKFDMHSCKAHYKRMRLFGKHVGQCLFALNLNVCQVFARTVKLWGSKDL